MTRAQPDIMAVIGSAFRDAWPLMRSRMSVYWIFAVLCAVGVLIGIWVGRFATAEEQQAVHLEIVTQPVDAVALIAAFFILPEVIRTARPDFKLTLIRVLAIIGIVLVVEIAAGVGLALLIVPGIWVGVKLSMAVYSYLLSEGKNPFSESWELTTGHFWHTLGFELLLAIFTALVELVVLFLPLGIAWLLPLPAAIVLSPIAFLGCVYVYHVSILAAVRWLLALRTISATELPLSPI